MNPWFLPMQPRGLLRAYLSGPMTGIEDHNYAAFDIAAMDARGWGLSVCSPAETSRILLQMQKLTYEQFLEFDAHRVLEADVLIVLAGHEISRGAKFEIFLADTIAKPIYSHSKILAANGVLGKDQLLYG